MNVLEKDKRDRNWELVIASWSDAYREKIIAIHQMIEQAADEIIWENEDTRGWVTTWSDRVMNVFVNAEISSGLTGVILGAQPQTLPTWNFVAEKLIDPDGEKLVDYIDPTKGGNVISRYYQSTLLSPDLFIRVTESHTRQAPEDIYIGRTLVGRDFLPGGTRYQPL